jgi:lipopolysaccharide biosynthesis protein
MEKKCRLIAFYLPQFHPIPENNLWWGEGFTEWTNVGKAKPLFKGHDQPKVPADLGYYDLRVSETRTHQADLAKKHGIEGFCYWHYWFGNGKKLLDRPFKEVLLSGNPDFPFCLAWANESWKGFAHGIRNRNLLISQEYPGEEDVKNHFFDVLPALKDNRYIKVNNKPVFLIYKPLNLPEAALFIKTWNKLALDNGLSGIFFIGQTSDIIEKDKILELGFDSINIIRIFDFIKKRSFLKKVLERFKVSLFKSPKKYNYASVTKYFTGDEDKSENVHPTIFPNWDHTPRSGNEGIVLHNSKPEFFKKHVLEILNNVKEKKHDTNIVFIKSWNEWAEGNYLEPDIKFGDKYLKVLKECIIKV